MLYFDHQYTIQTTMTSVGTRGYFSTCNPISRRSSNISPLPGRHLEVGSILGQIIRMRRLFRPYRLLDPRILKFPIDKAQELWVHVTSIDAHFVLFWVSRPFKRPPIHSVPRQSSQPKGQGCLTYTHPQVPQKSNVFSRSPHMYFMVIAFGFVSILTSSGL